MRIFINQSLLKEKKNSETYFGKRGMGGAFLFKMTLGTAMLKLQFQRAVKVFSVNLVILKKKQDNVFLTRYKEIKSIKPA